MLGPAKVTYLGSQNPKKTGITHIMTSIEADEKFQKQPRNKHTRQKPFTPYPDANGKVQNLAAFRIQVQQY